MNQNTLISKELTKGNRALLALSGKIDENSVFPKIKFAGISTLVFDFRGIKGINSMGIQAWIAFLKSVPSNITVAFQHCPLRIVNQMNLFPAFMGSRPVKVVSFYAPYYCAPCDKSETLHVSVKDLGAGLSLPKKNCSQCQKTMELGAIEEKYLLFLKRK